MNALPTDLARAAQALSAAVTQPIPGSRKVHVQGIHADLRVPMREILQAATPFGRHGDPQDLVADLVGVALASALRRLK